VSRVMTDLVAGRRVDLFQSRAAAQGIPGHMGHFAAAELEVWQRDFKGIMVRSFIPTGPPYLSAN
jgi:hypothetical protein